MRRNTWMVKLAAGLGSLLLIGGLCACSTQEEETSSLVSQVEDVSLFPEGASIGGKNIAGKTVDEAMKLAETFHKLMESRGKGLNDEQAEESLEDGIVFQGVSQYPMRIKCALLGWEGMKDAVAKALAAKA